MANPEMTDEEFDTFIKFLSDRPKIEAAKREAAKPKPLTKEQIHELYLNGGHKSKPGVHELLFISPDLIANASKEPASDELTEKIDYIISKTYQGEGDAKKMGFNEDVDWGSHQYFGRHRVKGGPCSDVQDWYIPTKDGVWTNSLAAYYVKHYREYIPQIEIDKIERIYKELMEKK
jgi:hypothetical protein